MEAGPPEATVKIDPKHDFTSKLRQPSIWPRLKDYIEWQRQVREARGRGENPPAAPDWLMPISINLDLTTACNYRCPHCIDWEILNSGINYEHEKLMASLTGMIERGLRSVILIGGGEPTIHPKFREVVRFLKERKVQVAIVSNGARNEVIYDVAEHFTEKDWVRLSLDSGTDDTFQKMHLPRRPITLEEICSWVPKIRERNPKLSVGFSFIIVWEGAEREKNPGVVANIDEIVAATKLARAHRFNYISFKPFLTRTATGAEIMKADAIEYYERTIARIRAAIEEAKTHETEDFKILESTNLRLLEQGNWRDFTRQPAMCHMQAFRHVLSPLGLFNCPAHRGVPKARISDKNAFSDEDASRATRGSIASMLESFDASRECAHVTCLYNSANWWIEKAIRGELDLAELEALEEKGDWFL